MICARGRTSMSNLAASAAPDLANAVSNATSEELPEYQKCSCIGTLPGRACNRCFSTGYVKRCPSCHGSGILFKNNRSGSLRTEPCGECAARGWKPCMPREIREAMALAQEMSKASESSEASAPEASEASEAPEASESESPNSPTHARRRSIRKG